MLVRKNDLFQNGPLHPVGDFNGGRVLQIAPNFNKIEHGFGRENIAPHLAELRFLFSQVSFQAILSYALAAVELCDAAPNLCVYCVSVSYEPPILFLLRLKEMQQCFLRARGAGRLNLPLYPGLQGRIMDFDVHGTFSLLLS